MARVLTLNLSFCKKKLILVQRLEGDVTDETRKLSKEIQPHERLGGSLGDPGIPMGTG